VKFAAFFRRSNADSFAVMLKKYPVRCYSSNKKAPAMPGPLSFQ